MPERDAHAPATYYLASAGEVAPRAALEGDAQAEVCVVGAGFAGLATALGLVERGVRDVVVLEGRRVGHGASGRNGGFVFGGFSLDPADLLAQRGASDARALYALTRQAVDLIRQRIARHALDCDAVEGGALLADWFGDEAGLRRIQHVMAQSFGVTWQRLTKAQLDAHVRSDRYHGGLLEPDAFHFHPLKYARGLACVLEAAGVRVHEHTPATALRRDGDGWRGHTPGGRVRARHVVVAGGGYLSGLVPALERAILPIATYVMVTEPLGEAATRLIPSPAAIYDTRFAFDYYRRLPDTRLLWGGRIAVRERRPEAIARFLRADMLKVFPSLRDARVAHAWGGLMSYARHKMPLVGRLPDAGPWYALGFGGHGVAPTTVAGELLAQAIAHGAPLPAALAHYGLAPTFRPFGLAAAQGTYTWLQWRDAWRARGGVRG